MAVRIRGSSASAGAVSGAAALVAHFEAATASPRRGLHALRRTRHLRHYAGDREEGARVVT